ncbi:MAG: HAD-IIA family hydrolase [Jatrophihabitans sp.]
MSSTLSGADQPLADLYDVALLDLDGVVYVGTDAVPTAPAALAAVRERGVRLAFVTNNAARSPLAVAEHLTELGVAATAAEVVTSAQAAARYLADRLPGGSRVLVIGTTGLHEALEERGLGWTSEDSDDVAAVVQGYSPETNWKLLAEGAVAINRGVLWVATNADPTVPSARGPLPGNGSLVAALRTATRREPVVTGKPDPTMHRETVIRTKAERPLVVGDRLDTDIEGATAVGCPSLLVFSGVTTPVELLAASQSLRPTYVAADLTGLLVGHPEPRLSGRGASCGQWAVTVDGDELVLETDARSRQAGGRGRLTEPGKDSRRPTPSVPPSAAGGGVVGHGAAEVDPARTPREAGYDDDVLDAVRALCAAQWNRGGSGEGLAGVRASEGDQRAARMVTRLGLSTKPQ